MFRCFSGIGTSAVYCDPGLNKGGFPFECFSAKQRTIVVKTHRPEKHSHTKKKASIILPFEKAILLIRNPYDFLVANIYSSHLDTVDEDAYFESKSMLYTLWFTLVISSPSISSRQTCFCWDFRPRVCHNAVADVYQSIVCVSLATCSVELALLALIFGGYTSVFPKHNIESFKISCINKVYSCVSENIKWIGY